MMEQKKLKKPELMSPAGNWVMLRAAIEQGANAVYLGADKLNMRAKAKNFTLDELPEITEFCHSQNVKVYLTVNTIILEDQRESVDEILIKAKNSQVDMIICWDIAVIQKCKKYSIPFCISTQASISNSESVEFYKNLGASRVVLARECSLEEIKKIRNKTDIEIETFIHGAMCIAVSGRCFLSHDIYNKSANQGDCMQPCRREYEIYDNRIDTSLLIGKDYVLSAKDLCTINFIDQLIETGIDSFKIEGRKRSPEYVAKVTAIYRYAIDLYFEGKLSNEIKNSLYFELSEVYNRGFSNGFYFGKPDAKDFAEVNGNASKVKKEYVGKVLNYYKTPSVCYIEVMSNPVKLGDKLLITGNTTGLVEIEITELLLDDSKITQSRRGDKITFPCEKVVRENDSVYLITINH